MLWNTVWEYFLASENLKQDEIISDKLRHGFIKHTLAYNQSIAVFCPQCFEMYNWLSSNNKHVQQV